MENLQERTVKELQDMIIDLGMPREDAEAIKTKVPLIASINALRTKDAQAQTEEVEKVKTIEEKPDPVEERRVNKSWKSKAEIMRDKLLAQPKVRVLIPLEPKEQAGVVEWHEDSNGIPFQKHISGDIITPQLNGYKFMIPKGRYYEVPQQVAELVSNAEEEKLNAGSDISVNRVDHRTGRPMSDAL